MDARSKDALKEMDTSCININIPPRVLFLFSSRLFYCEHTNAATFSGQRFSDTVSFVFHDRRIEATSLHFRVAVIVIMHDAE